MKMTERLVLGLALESMTLKDTLYLEESGLNFFNSNNDVDVSVLLRKLQFVIIETVENR